MSEVAWTRAELEERLRAKERFYHIHHPFHVLMNAGKLDREAIQGWVANRFYYQVSIPVKDAAVLANCPDRGVRREWIKRIIDHDGTDGDEGGIEAWSKLGEAVGLARPDLWSLARVLPGVRFAVDAYVNFARRASWQEAACSSLTELFAPAIHQQRLDGWPKHYPWIEPTCKKAHPCDTLGIQSCVFTVCPSLSGYKHVLPYDSWHRRKICPHRLR